MIAAAAAANVHRGRHPANSTTGIFTEDYPAGENYCYPCFSDEKTVWPRKIS